MTGQLDSTVSCFKLATRSKNTNKRQNYVQRDPTAATERCSYRKKNSKFNIHPWACS